MSIGKNNTTVHILAIRACYPCTCVEHVNDFVSVCGFMHTHSRQRRQGERVPHCTELLNSCSAPSGLSIMSLSLNHNQTWAEQSGSATSLLNENLRTSHINQASPNKPDLDSWLNSFYMSALASVGRLNSSSWQAPPVFQWRVLVLIKNIPASIIMFNAHFICALNMWALNM